MAAPYSIVKEVDLSTRVPSFPGVYGAMVIPAVKGSTEPFLVTSEKHFLDNFSENGKVEISYDLSYFSAIQYLGGSNKLWVSRAVTSPKLSAIVFSTGNPTKNTNMSISYPMSYDFGQTGDFGIIYSAGTGTWFEQLDVEIHKGTKDDTFGITVYKFDEELETFDNLTYSTVENEINYNSLYIRVETNQMTNDDKVKELEDKGTDGRRSAFEGADGAVLSSIKIKTNPNGDPIPTVNVISGSAPHDAVADRWSGTPTPISNPDGYPLDADDCFMITSANVGFWGNNILVTITSNDSRIKEPKSKNPFVIDVYKSTDLNNPVETKIVTRLKGVKDGYGSSMYIEDVLKSSNYIRAYDNPIVDESVMPFDLAVDFNGIQVPVPESMDLGSNGTGVSTGAIINSSDKLNAKQSYPITLLMDSGLSFIPYQQNLIKIAEKRQDCVAILSTPLSLELSANYLNELVTWKNSKFNPNTSYAALYTPHVIIYDKDNDREVPVSPDGIVGSLISKTASNYEIWYPVGGRKRGKVIALDLIRRFSDGELDYLYDNSINPIKFMVGKGITVEGQKTLQAYASSLDRLNVRLMLIVIETAIMEAMENFKFELNTAETRVIAKSIIDNYMEGIKARKGVYDYLTVCNDTNNSSEDIDNHLLNVMLLVKPTQAIEYVETTVVITRTGMDFKVAAAAV